VKVNVYIDGFNLYNRAVKKTPFKWLNLLQVSQYLLPDDQISRIRYFTSLVKVREGDPDSYHRQLIYIRALQTIPQLTVHYGQFNIRKITRPLVNPIPGLPSYVEVWNTEEKRTDVNLASYLLTDGFDHDYEQAMVISNDSDLALPVRMVKEKLGLRVVVVNPNYDQLAPMPKALRDSASFDLRLWPNTLRKSQFPQQLRDSTGIITKPAGW